MLSPGDQLSCPRENPGTPYEPSADSLLSGFLRFGGPVGAPVATGAVWTGQTPAGGPGRLQQDALPAARWARLYEPTRHAWACFIPPLHSLGAFRECVFLLASSETGAVITETRGPRFMVLGGGVCEWTPRTVHSTGLLIVCWFVHGHFIKCLVCAEYIVRD